MAFKLRLLVPVAAIAAVLGGTTASGRVLGGGCVVGASWGQPRQALAPAVIQLVNAHRATLGLRALQSTPSLTASAVWKARHMARYGYFGHDDPAPPVARTALDRIRACGYTGNYVGENIADGFRTPATVMQAWLNSPGHRENIENPNFGAIGVGVAASSSGTVYWVQDFGSSVDGVGPQILRARRDVRVIRRNRSIVIRVLSNDRHPAGSALGVLWITAPHHGNAYLRNGIVTYRPSPNFVGRDSFRYAITDGLGGTSTARVLIHVRR